MAKKPGGLRRDVNENAARIVALTTGQETPVNVLSQSEEEKRLRSEAAAMLGKLGGSKGGKMRAQNLSAKRRTDIARKAAHKRWDRRSTG